MGDMRESLEVSIAAAIELDYLDPDEHAAIIEGARAAADALDSDNATASMLGTTSTTARRWASRLPSASSRRSLAAGASRSCAWR